MPADDTLTLVFTRQEAFEHLSSFLTLSTIADTLAPQVEYKVASVADKLDQLRAFLASRGPAIQE